MRKTFLLTLFIIQSLALHALGQGHQTPPAEPTEETCQSQVPGEEIDMGCIEEQLTTSGLGGWVHASVKDQLLLVFTWRRPGNFFINVQLPMFSKDPVILEKLSQLRRHDQIFIKGEFFKNDAPINHINVTELEVVKAYDGPLDQFEYDPKLPDSITSGNKLIGKVHIVANGGSVVVVEVGDRVFPVFNEKPELARDLYRNDKIELSYNVQFLPQRPSHLSVDTEAPEPIRVLEKIVEGHGEPIVLTGPLVMFPESPQIIFNVFALRTEDQEGVSRNFTIVNFDDFNLFFAIREKLQKVWDEQAATSEYDRNKYINRKIQVTVTGTKSVVSPNQANPQVVPIAIEDVKIEIL